MKRGITLIVLMVGFLSWTSAQEVMQEQRTLLTKKTATWCPHCGAWGWTLMKNIVQDNSEKAVLVGAHYSGDLRSSAATELVSIFGGPGQPIFYANTANLNVSSGNIDAKRTEVKNLVDNNFNQSPLVNAGLEVKDNGVDLDIKVKTEFFESTTGDYRVAVWVLENNVENAQSGQSGNPQHPFVLRTTANGVTGDLFATGAITAGETSEMSFSVDVNPSWDMDNLSFAAVIWKDNGGSYVFENVYSVDEIQLSTSTDDLSDDLEFTLKPSILRVQTALTFTLQESREVSVKIYDLLGKEVMRGPSVVYPSGTHEVVIDRSEVGGKGMYLVTLESQGQVYTKRLLVE